MRCAVRIWDSIREKKLEDLSSDELRDVGENVKLALEKYGFMVLGENHHFSNPLRFLESIINIHLRPKLHPKLEIRDNTHHDSKMIFSTESLLDFMWLQFSWSIMGNIEYRQCLVCHRWFEIAIGSGRKDKKYCSRACQMRAHRKRKAAKS